jgi:hypothetical protein
MKAKTIIRASCTDQVLKLTDSPIIAAGGQNEVAVAFSFCEKWDGFAKTATFYRDEEAVYYAVLDENDTCVVPWEVYFEAGTFYFGVFGEKDGVRRTSNVVRYRVKKGSVTSDMMPSEPSPGVYEQILAQLGEANALAQELRDEVEEANNIARAATETANAATEVANNAVSVANEANVLNNEIIAQVQKDIADLKYVPIDITQIAGGKTVEMGTVVNDVTVSWTLNKEPASQTLDGADVDVSARSKAFTGLALTGNKTFNLSVTDERGAKDSASTAISFLNGVYYGVLESGAEVESAAILTLTRKLQGSNGITFTANAGATQQIAYAIPTRYGTPNFNVGGFDGGFAKVKTFDFTNASGYTESYDVWLSENVGLGSTTVKVS